MKIITKIGFQGDVCFKRVKGIPKGEETREGEKKDGAFVVAHSETGHDHVISPESHARLLETKDPFVAYLVAEGAYADCVHQRSFDTHETIRLEGKPGSVWMVIREREMGPEGWVRAQD
jgi:hypothetical protein